MDTRHNPGFTLLEILLVVGAIAILAGIVIVAINPGKQLADTRNSQRWTDVRTIASAINQYRISVGSLPSTLSGGGESGCEDEAYEICITDASSCTGLLSLAVLTNNDVYLPSIPIDPSGQSGDSVYGTGYHAVTDATGTRVIVCAPNAENLAVDIIAIQ
jgi:prepilin-type N-terminal cleavage/methylation domain-containing protein